MPDRRAQDHDPSTTPAAPLTRERSARTRSGAPPPPPAPAPPIPSASTRSPPRGGGRIGMTFCPGKRQRGAAMGDWERDLAADLARIADWGAAAVATLMEQHELERYGVPGLGEAVEALGMEWHHLPIPDVGVPDSLFEARWFYAGHRLRAHLLAGRRVLLHCRGGLGRTGTIAARLLVELGAAPERGHRRGAPGEAGRHRDGGAGGARAGREADRGRAGRIHRPPAGLPARRGLGRRLRLRGRVRQPGGDPAALRAGGHPGAGVPRRPAGRQRRHADDAVHAGGAAARRRAGRGVVGGRRRRRGAPRLPRLARHAVGRRRARAASRERSRPGRRCATAAPRGTPASRRCGPAGAARSGARSTAPRAAAPPCAARRWPSSPACRSGPRPSGSAPGPAR